MARNPFPQREAVLLSKRKSLAKIEQKKKRKLKQKSYVTWTTMDDVDSFLIAYILPKTI